MKRAAAGGLAVTAVATGIAWNDDAARALGITVVCLLAALLVLAVTACSGREHHAQ